MAPQLHLGLSQYYSRKAWNNEQTAQISCVVGGAAFFMLLAPPTSYAIPPFARKYQTSCQTCHLDFLTHKLPRSPWMNSSTVAAFVSMMHSISTFPAASLTAIEMLALCTSMPIYFLLSTWVLLSVGSEPTLPAYAERGALFHNALTLLKMLLRCGRPYAESE